MMLAVIAHELAGECRYRRGITRLCHTRRVLASAGPPTRHWCRGSTASLGCAAVGPRSGRSLSRRAHCRWTGEHAIADLDDAVHERARACALLCNRLTAYHAAAMALSTALLALLRIVRGEISINFLYPRGLRFSRISPPWWVPLLEIDGSAVLLQLA